MEGEFSCVVDGFFGIIWIVLFDGSVDFVNWVWCEYIGMGQQWVVGDGWLVVVYLDDQVELCKGWNSIFVLYQLQDMWVCMWCVDGVWCWFVLCVVLVCDVMGKFVYWFVMVIDIEDYW